MARDESIRQSVGPASPVLDPADLRLGQAELGCQLDALASDLSAPGYLGRLLRRHLGGYAALAVLHRPVLAHVELVLAMRRPAQVADVVVRRVAVVVRNVSQRWIGRPSEKGDCNEPVRHASAWVAARVAKDVGLVAVPRLRPRKFSRVISEAGKVRVSPSADSLAPAAHIPVLVDLVAGESLDFSPFGVTVHGC